MIKKMILYKLVIVLSLLLIITVFLYKQNNDIVITEIKVASDKIPSDFAGFRILQISDLHNKQFGKNQKKLISKINKIMPDIIVVTGDTIDSRRYNDKPSLELLNQVSLIASVYLVTGNHEARSGKFKEFQKELELLGINVLRNEAVVLNKNESEIVLLGVDDPEFQLDKRLNISNEILNLMDSRYAVLLSHRPEFMDYYAEHDFDLIFTGHAHGGQIRLPFIGGLVAPNQGFLPQYTEGSYKVNETIMIVSRGLGNSIFPQRLFNRPELVIVTLVPIRE